MTDRRRYQRFLLRVPLQGSLRFANDVLFERYDGEEIQVVSPVPAGPNEMLRINDVALRPPLALAVRVEESSPVMIDGSLHHRLRLRPTTAPDDVQRAELMVSLGHEVPVRVLEICRTGCLLETEEQVEAAAVGELTLVIAGRVSSAVVRVARSLLVPGRPRTHRVGGVFLSRGRCGGSLPLAIDRLASEQEWKASEAAAK